MELNVCGEYRAEFRADELEQAMANERNNPMPRKAVYSFTEVAAMCGISRARFYDLVHDGVMPWPVYCTRTRRPLYPADMAALCVRVKETNIGIDGRYVMFYSRRETQVAAVRQEARPKSADPLMKEMIETLRAMNAQGDDEQLTAAIVAQCPSGVREESFEADLRAVFDRLRCRSSG
jgi:hypothetical protein